MSYQEHIVKIMEGITDFDTRKNIMISFHALLESYKAGRMSEKEFKEGLLLLCYDILSLKSAITVDEGILKDQAKDWAEKIYKAVKSELIKEKYLSRLRIRE
jgi:hypothetical protein